MGDINNILFQKGEKIVIKPDKKFSYPESQCYKWNENIVLQYFVEKLDLMGYQDAICSYPVDGYVFLSLNDGFPLPELKFSHPMHSYKVQTHSQRIRELCYNSIEKLEKPQYLEDFQTIHIAHHLAKKKDDLKGSLAALRFHFNYAKLQQINNHGTFGEKRIDDLLSASEKERLINEVRELFQTYPSENVKQKKKAEAKAPEKKTTTVDSEGEGNGGKESRPSTAMKKRKVSTTDENIPEAKGEGETKEEKLKKEKIKEKENEKPKESEKEKLTEKDEAPVEIKKEKSSAPVASEPQPELSKSKVQIKEPPIEEKVPPPQVKSISKEKSKSALLQPPPPLKESDDEDPEEDNDNDMDDIETGDQEVPNYRTMTTVTIPGKKKKLKSSKKKSTKKNSSAFDSFMNEIDQDINDNNNNEELKEFLTEERKRFNTTVKQLQKMIDVHAKTIQHLQEKSHQLEKENVKQKKEFFQLFTNQSTNHEDLIHSLIQDRHATTNSVEKLVHLFGHTQSNMLQMQQQQQQQNAMNPMLAMAMATMMNGQANPLISTLSGTNPMAFLSQMNNSGGNQPEMKATDSDLDSVGDDHKPKDLPVKSQANKTVTIIDPVPTIQQPSAISTGKPMALTNDSPVTIAKETLKATTNNSTNNEELQSKELHDMIEGTYKKDFKLWKRFFNYYKLPTEKLKSQNICSFLKDTRQLLLQIAMKWLKLGKKLLYDFYHPTSQSTEAIEFQDCLKGLMKYTKNMNESYRESLIQSIQKNSTNKSQTLLLCSEDNMDAISMVFGLLLMQRSMDKCQSMASNSIAGSNNVRDNKVLQFTSLFNSVRVGDFPVMEVSRDNLRDFIDETLGVDLSWDKFDSICQRIDKEKKGFISNFSLLTSFLTQIHYLTEKYNSFDAIFQLFYYLTLLSNSILSYCCPIPLEQQQQLMEQQQADKAKDPYQDKFDESTLDFKKKDKDKDKDMDDQKKSRNAELFIEPKTLNEFFVNFFTQKKFQRTSFSSMTIGSGKQQQQSTNTTTSSHSDGIQKYLLRLANQANDPDGIGWDDNKSMTSATGTARGQWQSLQIESQIIDDQLLIIDIFHELLDPIASQLEMSWNYARSEYLSSLFPEANKNMKTQLFIDQFIGKTLANNSEKNEVLIYLCKSLNIFYELSSFALLNSMNNNNNPDDYRSNLNKKDKKKEDILNHFQLLVKYFILFRYQSIQEILMIQQEKYNSNNDKATNKKDNRSFNDEELVELFAKLDSFQEVNNLLPDENSVAPGLLELESIFTELLGIPLPVVVLDLNFYDWLLPDFLSQFASYKSIPFPPNEKKTTTMMSLPKEMKKEGIEHYSSSVFLFMQTIVEFFIQKVSPFLYETDFSMGMMNKRNNMNNKTKTITKNPFDFTKTGGSSSGLFSPKKSKTPTKKKTKKGDQDGDDDDDDEGALANKKHLSDLQKEIYKEIFGQTYNPNSASHSPSKKKKKNRKGNDRDDDDDDDGDELMYFQNEKKNRSLLLDHDDPAAQLANSLKQQQKLESITKNSHLLMEANKTMNTQRMEQLTSFLDILNHRAIKKKHLLKTLMELWNATKIIVEEHYRYQQQSLKRQQAHEEEEYLSSIKQEEEFFYLKNSSIAQKRKAMGLDHQSSEQQVKDMKQSFLKKRLAGTSTNSNHPTGKIMPIEDIFQQTTQIQNVLLKDIQSPEAIKHQQLENRIEIIRKGVKDQSILFENEEMLLSFESLFLQIDSLKNGLLQANNDAVKISAKIIQQLNEVSGKDGKKKKKNPHDHHDDDHDDQSDVIHDNNRNYNNHYHNSTKNNNKKKTMNQSSYYFDEDSMPLY